MGTEQVKAGALYTGGPLSFEGFPREGTINTSSAEGTITDSAAASTAMATGLKVMNGVLSIRLPGDARDMQTVLEHYKAEGKSVGLVTTSTVTHATPAAFAAHVSSRQMGLDIAGQMLTEPLPEVIMGGSKYLLPRMAARKGYLVVTDRDGLNGPDITKGRYLAGLFGKGHMPYEYDGTGELPHLSEMVEAALDVLDNDPDGLFLMVEGGRIDHAAHDNNIERLVAEVAEFSNSVSMALHWATNHPDTLIIVTADHETGGLSILRDNGPGVPPGASWSTRKHTAKRVPVYARGPGAVFVRPEMENTEIHKALLGQGDHDR